MRVIFTEKFDVAKHVADYFGIKSRLDGAYLLDNGDYVTCAIGHLLSNGSPEDYAPNRLVQIPVLPMEFKYFPILGKEKQLEVVIELFKRADVIVNACDSDREGQWIFNLIARYAGIDPNQNNIERVLLNAFNAASLKFAFQNIKKNSEKKFYGAALAGECRSEADWLIGLNCSRAVKIALKHTFPKISVGRVQTPVLHLIVQREMEIQSFRSIEYYVPEIRLPDGKVLTWAASENDCDMRGLDEHGRIIDRHLATAIVEEIQAGLDGKVINYQETKISEPPPLPFSLAKLQAEMSARIGMSAIETSRAAQSLYVSKKMISYIGTNCRHLPESMHADSQDVLKGLSEKYNRVASGANPARKSDCWDDDKAAPEVSSHHAIIPTGVMSTTSLNQNEKLVFDVIARRYMAQFYPEHEYTKQALTVQYGGNIFKSVSKNTTTQGWKVVDNILDPNEVEDETAHVEVMKIK